MGELTSFRVKIPCYQCFPRPYSKETAIKWHTISLRDNGIALETIWICDNCKNEVYMSS